MSDLQRDIELVSMALGIAFDDNDPAAEAWQRIRARLAEQSSAVASVASSPDRERVARAIADTYWLHDESWKRYLPQADAAIAAMGETP